jgi:hypothetical protein
MYGTERLLAGTDIAEAGEWYSGLPDMGNVLRQARQRMLSAIETLVQEFLQRDLDGQTTTTLKHVWEHAPPLVLPGANDVNVFYRVIFNQGGRSDAIAMALGRSLNLVISAADVRHRVLTICTTWLSPKRRRLRSAPDLATREDVFFTTETVNEIFSLFSPHLQDSSLILSALEDPGYFDESCVVISSIAYQTSISMVYTGDPDHTEAEASVWRALLEGKQTLFLMKTDQMSRDLVNKLESLSSLNSTPALVLVSARMDPLRKAAALAKGQYSLLEATEPEQSSAYAKCVWCPWTMTHDDLPLDHKDQPLCRVHLERLQSVVPSPLHADVHDVDADGPLGAEWLPLYDEPGPDSSTHVGSNSNGDAGADADAAVMDTATDNTSQPLPSFFGERSNDLDALVDSAKTFFQQRGYKFNIRGTKKDAVTGKYLYKRLECASSSTGARRQVPGEQRKRHKTSVRTGCKAYCRITVDPARQSYGWDQQSHQLTHGSECVVQTGKHGWQQSTSHGATKLTARGLAYLGAIIHTMDIPQLRHHVEQVLGLTLKKTDTMSLYNLKVRVMQHVQKDKDVRSLMSVNVKDLVKDLGVDELVFVVNEALRRAVSAHRGTSHLVECLKQLQQDIPGLKVDIYVDDKGHHRCIVWSFSGGRLRLWRWGRILYLDATHKNVSSGLVPNDSVRVDY